jgi:mono/diheme cytochrome c family protein
MIIGLPMWDKNISDTGRYMVTKEKKDIGAFRTPSLRELKYTGPYMHNGTLSTLAEIVEFYDMGGGPHPNKNAMIQPLGLLTSEKAALVAFLESMSSDSMPYADARPAKYGEVGYPYTLHEPFKKWVLKDPGHHYIVKEKEVIVIPDEYKAKVMPAGWWGNPDVVAAGKALYQDGFDVKTKKGNIKKQKCAKCHGVSGRPKAKKARDFRVATRMNSYTDGHLFWRVSEGVPKTKMKGWKEWLSEEQRWQVLAYIYDAFTGGRAYAPAE